MTAVPAAGTLYLVPASLGPAPVARTTPGELSSIVASLEYFIVENAKSARAELKRLDHPRPLRDLDIRELPKAADRTGLDALLEPVLAGRDAGLMSDAGCPAVADPGALLVAAAHRRGVRVAPLVGPSSILLALMGSGLNGQRFCFHGYLPVGDRERDEAIRALEAESRRLAQTQIFIETPYRNMRMLDALLAHCRPDTRVCVARELTTDSEWIRTRTVSGWKKAPPPQLERRPAIFLMLAG